jgi:hypothetical protein
MKENIRTYPSVNTSTNTLRCVNEFLLEVSCAFAQKLEDSGLAPPDLASVGSVALPITYFGRSENRRRQRVEPWPTASFGFPIHPKPDEKTPFSSAKGDLPSGVPPTVSKPATKISTQDQK